MKKFTDIELKENEKLYVGRVDYYSTKWKCWFKTDTIGLTWDGITGRLFKRTKTGQIKEFKVYVNNFSSGSKKVSYFAFHYTFLFPDGETRGTVIKFHNALAQIAKLPFYKKGKVADHIDNNTLNNNLDNLQWITKGENSRLSWVRMTEDEKKERITKYSEGVKAGHARGSYKKHLNELHDYMNEHYFKNNK